MLTKTEAVDFLTNVLEIPEVPGLLNNQDRHHNIDVIMESYREQIPFQNIGILSVDFGSRRRPSWRETKDAMFLKQGGVCYTHHVFIFSLLAALGYDVYLGLAVYNCVYKNHILVFIKNLEKMGDVFLLDVGTVYPCFHLIPLDFEQETNIYVDSYLEYKYIKHNSKIMRMHRTGDPRKPETVKDEVLIDGWIRFYEFDFEFQTQNFRDLDKEFDLVYTDPHATLLHSTLYFTIYKNKKAIIVYNDRFLTENENNDLEKVILKTDDDVVNKIRELSPAFKPDDILAAIRNYKLKKDLNDTPLTPPGGKLCNH